MTTTIIPISFNGTKFKTGNSYVVVIPMGIAKLLEDDREYKFTITDEEDE